MPVIILYNSANAQDFLYTNKIVQIESPDSEAELFKLMFWVGKKVCVCR